MQETESLLHEERLKEKHGKREFLYDMEQIFDPVIEKQKQSQIQTKLEPEIQIQALRDSTQTTTQPIEDQTRAIRESSNALNKNLQNSIKEGIQD